jgi:hypothetical protein
MSTEQIIDEIKKMSPAERAEVEQALSILKEEEQHNGNGGERTTESSDDVISRSIARSRQAPPEEIAKLPCDLAKNHDHYLYGAPKK